MRSVDRLSPAYRAYIQRLGKTHAVESHEDGRRRQLTRLFVEEVEPRDELLIETRDLSVEDQRRGWQPPNGVSDLGEALGMVTTGTAHQRDAGAVLVGDDAPAIHLLFVDLTIAVERRGEERSEHRSYGG